MDKDNDKNPAADMIRKRVEQAYMAEPDASKEARAMAGLKEHAKLSKHQKFIADLSGSGKSAEEIQIGWHEYYAGLTDEEKRQVWQEFHTAQTSSARHPAVVPKKPHHHKAGQYPDVLKSFSRAFGGFTKNVLTPTGKHKPAKKPKSALHSLLFGLSMGGIAVFIVLFGFFNERFIAPLIQPSRTITNIPLIGNSPVGADPEVIIPKINVQIPVVYGVTTLNEKQVDKALEGGVVHYADTALPGQKGNVVIVGHSSNNLFNKGKYKFAFVLLNRMELGDTFYLEKDGKRYTYQIYLKRIVKPTDVSVLGSFDKPSTATLITCDPPGTSRNRLVVVGEQVSPDPAKNRAIKSSSAQATQSKIIPGNAPSLWSRMWGWVSR